MTEPYFLCWDIQIPNANNSSVSKWFQRWHVKDDRTLHPLWEHSNPNWTRQISIEMITKMKETNILSGDISNQNWDNSLVLKWLRRWQNPTLFLGIFTFQQKKTVQYWNYFKDDRPEHALVPADIAANNVIIVCKKYYTDTLVKELGINNVNINNPTYIPIDDSFETVMKSHNQFITSVGLEMSEEDQNLPYLYWTPKLHKSPYKHRFIAGSSKCTTKDLSCLLTKVLSTIKDGLVRYCNTKTSRNGVNNMWILKNSTSLLSSPYQLDVRTATSVQTFDFPTLYTSIPHDLLKI